MSGDKYIIKGGAEGKERLQVLTDVLYDSTRSLLLSQGLSGGMHLLDMGCGGGGVSFIAADMVGASGAVTSVDFDEKIITLAKADASSANRSNIDFIVADAYAIDFQNEFDITFSRFLLSHLIDPQKVLKLMVQATKPGGKIVVTDLQFSGHFCYPKCNAFDQYVRLYMKAADNNGQNPEIGPALVGMFKEAGLRNIGFDVIQPTFNKGTGKWMGYITLEKIKSSLLDQQLITEQGFNGLLSELNDFTEREDTIISMPRLFRVWGQK